LWNEDREFGTLGAKALLREKTKVSEGLEKNRPSVAKALHIFLALSARLTPCPFKA
jgi:hypothetical protein